MDKGENFMKVSQVYAVLNSLCKDILGAAQYVDDNGSAFNPATGVPYVSTDVDPTSSNPVTLSYFVQEDLSNVVDIGKLITKDNVGSQVDEHYFSKVYASLINHIGKVVFVDRLYKPLIPRLMKSNWEYGSIVEKIDAMMPESKRNAKWELTDGETYNQDTFHSPKGIRVKFFNDAVTFEIEMSFTEDQLKQSFSSASQLNSFMSMIATKISNRMTIDFANLTRATINSFIAELFYADYSASLNNSTHKYNYGTTIGKRAINLLQMYKNEVDSATTLTAATCLKDAEFMRFAITKIGLYSDRLEDIATLFNVGKRERFTPKDRQMFILNAEFAHSAQSYLMSDTYHDEYIKLPKHETINFWQGVGEKYDTADTMKIHTVSMVSSDGDSFTKKETIIENVIGFIADEDALGINNERQKTTSHYNGNGDFVNMWYKAFGRYFNDFDENGVVFFVA